MPASSAVTVIVTVACAPETSAPRLQVIVVVPRYPDVERRLYLDAARLGHGEALAMVRARHPAHVCGVQLEVLKAKDVQNGYDWCSSKYSKTG
jgi:hypothetical protein